MLEQARRDTHDKRDALVTTPSRRAQHARHVTSHRACRDVWCDATSGIWALFILLILWNASICVTHQSLAALYVLVQWKHPRARGTILTVLLLSSTVGTEHFPVAAAHVVNELPCPRYLRVVWRRVKTHIFKRLLSDFLYCHVRWLFVTTGHFNRCCYLLSFFFQRLWSSAIGSCMYVCMYIFITIIVIIIIIINRNILISALNSFNDVTITDGIGRTFHAAGPAMRGGSCSAGAAYGANSRLWFVERTCRNATLETIR